MTPIAFSQKNYIIITFIRLSSSFRFATKFVILVVNFDSEFRVSYFMILKKEKKNAISYQIIIKNFKKKKLIKVRMTKIRQ